MAGCAPLTAPRTPDLTRAEWQLLRRLRRRPGASSDQVRGRLTPRTRHRARLAHLVEAGLVVPATAVETSSYESDSITLTVGNVSTSTVRTTRWICDPDELHTGALRWRLSAWGSYIAPSGAIIIGGKQLPQWGWWRCERGTEARRIAAARLRNGEAATAARTPLERARDAAAAVLCVELGEERTYRWLAEPRDEFGGRSADDILTNDGATGAEVVAAAAELHRAQREAKLADTGEAGRSAQLARRWVRSRGHTVDGEHGWCCTGEAQLASTRSSQ